MVNFHSVWIIYIHLNLLYVITCPERVNHLTRHHRSTNDVINITTSYIFNTNHTPNKYLSKVCQNPNMLEAVVRVMSGSV